MALIIWIWASWQIGVFATQGLTLLGLSSWLFGTGLMLASIGFCYTQLPVDLIPDWIPIIGTLDDALANVVVVTGVIFSLVGHLLHRSLVVT